MRNSVLALGFLLAAAASAQTGTRDWGSLASLQPGQKVGVILNTGSNFSGEWESFTADALRVRTRKQVREALVRDVQSVVRLGRKSRGKAAVYGFLIGFAPGFVAGTVTAAKIADRNDVSSLEAVGAGLAVGVIFGGIGAALGAAIGTQPTVLIYRAPKQARSGRCLTGIAAMLRPRTP